MRSQRFLPVFLIALACLTAGVATLIGRAAGFAPWKIFALSVTDFLLVGTAVAAVSHFSRSAKLNTKELENREWDFTQFQDATLSGYCYWEAGSEHVHRSYGYLRLLGLSPDSDPSSPELVQSHVPSEDQKAVLHRLSRMRAGENVEPETFRIVWPDGSEHRIWMDVRYWRDGTGKVLRTLVVARDVTHRHLAAKALEESHESMKRLVKALPGAVFQINRKAGAWRLGFLSEGAVELLGVSVSQNVLDFEGFLAAFGETSAARILVDLESSTAQLSTVVADYPAPRPDGAARWIHFRATPYGQEDGSITWYGIATDVTAAKLAEKSLRFTQFAMDHARDAMTLVATDGSNLYVNEEACRLTGEPRESLLQGKIFDSIVGLDEMSFRQLWAVVVDQGTHVVEAMLRTRTGAVKPIEITSTFLEIDGRNVLFAVTRDISMRRAAEAALRQVESRVRMIQYALDNAQDLVSLMDANGQRLYVNESFCRFTGFTANELLARKVWDGIPSLGESGFRELWGKIKKAGALSLEIDVRTHTGDLRPVESNCSFIVTDGVEAVCTVSRDLAPRRAAEKERAHIEQQFRETQKLESLGVLAGGVAHDFNNLLTGVLGNASLARDRLPEGDPLHGPLQQIEIASVRAAELCQQMLAYAGKGRVIVGPVDLSTLVSETANLLNASIAHRATLDLRLARRLPLVQADATQLRQIVMNLVMNASEAITHREGKIIVSTGTLQIDEAFLQSARVSGGLEPGDGVFIEVKDNGSGMDEATLERAFEPFFTTKFTGRGLGLAAVIGIVRAHAGALAVTSEPGAGTTFTLAFSPEPRRRRTRTPFDRTPASTKAVHGSLLIVDDEESVRSVAYEALTRSGYRVELAATGEGALSLVEAQEKHYDLILLDLTMPGRDGADVLKHLREKTPATPVIMMSGYSEDETRSKLGGLQADGFLMKPFNIGALRSKVDTVLRDQRNRQNQIQIPF